MKTCLLVISILVGLAICAADGDSDAECIQECNTRCDATTDECELIAGQIPVGCTSERASCINSCTAECQCSKPCQDMCQTDEPDCTGPDGECATKLQQCLDVCMENCKTTE